MSIGTAHTRVEGASKVRGAAKYAADIYPDGTLFAHMVGAPVAAGRVTGIDAARRRRGAGCGPHPHRRRHAAPGQAPGAGLRAQAADAG